MIGHIFTGCRSYSAVEEFDDVEDFLAGLMDGSTGAELEEAARIGGDDGLGARGLAVLHFLGE